MQHRDKSVGDILEFRQRWLDRSNADTLILEGIRTHAVQAGYEAWASSNLHYGSYHADNPETMIMDVVQEPGILKGDNTANYPAKAVYIIDQHLQAGFLQGQAPKFGTYVVWFNKTLRNWKALIGTTLPDGFYYEVTSNGDTGEYYVDTYKKVDQAVYRDA